MAAKTNLTISKVTKVSSSSSSDSEEEAPAAKKSPLKSSYPIVDILFQCLHLFSSSNTNN